MEDDGLLGQALALTETIQRRPQAELKGFISQIATLADSYQQLLFNLRASASTEESHTIEMHEVVSESRRRQSSVHSSPGRRRQSSIAGTIQSAFHHLPDIYDAVWHFHTPFGPETTTPVRIFHIQNILGLQKRRLHVAANASERILVLCACLSIAKDFRAFERRGGWQPKQDTLFDRLVKREDLAIQTVSKNFQKYIAAHNFGPPSNLQKLDAALRLGMKLSLVDQLGSRLSKKRNYSLLLGFAFDKFAKLSFSSLGTLCESLNEVDNSVMREFADVLGPWWSNCQEDYHSRFSDTASSHAACQPAIWASTSCLPPPAVMPVSLTSAANVFGDTCWSRRECGEELLGVWSVNGAEGWPDDVRG